MLATEQQKNHRFTGEDRYSEVNKAWPSDMRNPTAQEMLSGAKRLMKKFRGRAWQGKWEVTNGNRYSYPKRGIFYVNPDRGWKHLVHLMSHYIHAKLYPDGKTHGMGHAWLERTMTKYVIESGWIDGRLKREEKPKPDKSLIKYNRVMARIKKWKSVKTRAENALKKLNRQEKYYKSKLGMK